MIRDRQFLLVLLGNIFVIIAALWGFATFHTIQRYTYDDDGNLLPAKVLFSSPMYLSLNEEEELHFAIENTGSEEVQVLFRLVNAGDSYGFLASGDDTTLYSGSVQPLEQIEQDFTVFFPLSTNHVNHNRLGSEVGLGLWGKVGETSSFESIAEFPIMIAPIPWARSISKYLSPVVGGLVAWLFKELWDQARGDAP